MEKSKTCSKVEKNSKFPCTHPPSSTISTLSPPTSALPYYFIENPRRTVISSQMFQYMQKGIIILGLAVIH